MKKIAILAFSILLAGGVTESKAQDSPNETKSFRFGLHIDPTLSWYGPVDKKKYENGGIKMKFTIGAVADFKLAENIWFSSGLNFSFLGGKLGYLENAVADTVESIGYYLNNKEEILQGSTVDSSTFFSGNSYVRLQQRDFRVRYLSIPLLLKMKTKEIGYITYFGQFGPVLNLKMGSVKGNDVGDEYTFNSTAMTTTKTVGKEYTDLIIDKESAFMFAAINFGFGAEYTLSGSTSLYGILGFNYGLMSAVNKKSNHLLLNNSTNTNQQYKMNKGVNNHTLALTIGVMF